MTRLNTTQIQALEHILHQREQQLQQEIAAVHAENAQQAQALEDLPPEPDANQSGASAAREVRHAERMRDQQELQDVRAALQRIADGSYGECLDCGKYIAAARLQAFPQPSAVSIARPHTKPRSAVWHDPGLAATAHNWHT